MKRLLTSLLLTIGIITGAAGAIMQPHPMNGYGETSLPCMAGLRELLG